MSNEPGGGQFFPAAYNCAFDVVPGVTIGTVFATDDPSGEGRIRVQFSLKQGQILSDWVQILSIYAGPNAGAFFLPKKDDAVLLAFADGDPSMPYVLGFLWNGVQKPPVEQAKQQDVRVIKTRGGKTLTFDDSAQGNITIIDNNNNKIEIDTANNSINLNSTGNITITASKNVTISGENVVVQNKVSPLVGDTY